MSKHEKTLRRERKKTDRARRLMGRFRHPTSHIPHGAAALAAAAVIAAGTQAYASPVRFDNPAGPGHYDWSPELGDLTKWLDLTLGASAQPGTPSSPSSILQLLGAGGTITTVRGGVGGGELQSVYSWPYLTVGVDAGTLIPTGGYAWQPTTYAYYAGYPSMLPEGQETYLGVRFDLGGGNQYGWIGAVRTGVEVDAFAWGYETEVGVPIPAGIPEPGSLALLAFGALAVCRRRQA